MRATFFRRLKLGEAFAHRPQQRRILLTRERTALALSRVCQWRPFVLGPHVLGPYVLGMTIQIGRQSKAQSSDEPES